MVISKEEYLNGFERHVINGVVAQFEHGLTVNVCGVATRVIRGHKDVITKKVNETLRNNNRGKELTDIHIGKGTVTPMLQQIG